MKVEKYGESRFFFLSFFRFVEQVCNEIPLFP